MPEPTLVKGAEWVPLAAAADLLGRSERSIQRLAAAGAIRKNERGLYSAHDVANARNESLPAPRVADAPGDLPKHALAGLISERLGERLEELLKRRLALPAPEIAAAPRVPVTERLWLSIDEAHDLSGLARSDLRELVDNGRLTARRSGRSWRILRRSLEEFAG